MKSYQEENKIRVVWDNTIKNCYDSDMNIIKT